MEKTYSGVPFTRQWDYLVYLQQVAVLCSEGLPGEVAIVNMMTLLCALFGSVA